MAVKAAKKAAKKVATAPKAKRERVALTLGDVQVEDTLPTAFRTLDDTSQKLYDLVVTTYQQSKAVSLTLPNDQVSALKSRLNSVAKRANLGVRVREAQAGNGVTKVTFQGKERTLRPRNAE